MVIVISGFNNSGTPAFWTCLSGPATGMRFTSTVPYSDFCLKYPNTGVFAHGSYNLYICLYMHVFSYGIFKNCTQIIFSCFTLHPSPHHLLQTCNFQVHSLSATYHLLRFAPPSSSPQLNSPHWTPEKDILKLNWILEWYLQPPYNTAVHWTYHSCT